MRTMIDFQHLATGASRPSDDGECILIDATNEEGTVIIPDVGDYVQIDKSMVKEPHHTFSGRVRTRLFRYIDNGEETWCQVNVVVEDSDDDWGKVIKE